MIDWHPIQLGIEIYSHSFYANKNLPDESTWHGDSFYFTLSDSVNKNSIIKNYHRLKRFSEKFPNKVKSVKWLFS